MARYCIVCGEVPTASYTYPINMDEAFKWQSMLTEYVSAAQLRYHYCVCNKHIDGHTPDGPLNYVNKKSNVGSNKNIESNKQRPNVTFNAANAVRYFGDNHINDSSYSQLSDTSGSQQTFTKHLERKNGCTRLLTTLEGQSKKIYQNAPPLIDEYEQWASLDIANSQNAIDFIGKRSVSGSELTMKQSSMCNCYNNATAKGKTSIQIKGCTCDSSCLCRESSKPQLNLKAARQQQQQEQEQKQSKRQQPKQQQPNPQQPKQQQHRECQCHLSANCRNQTTQFPTRKEPSTDRSQFIDKNNANFECGSNTNDKEATINVLIMNGSNVPSYYNSTDHQQTQIAEICVLESDLAHEGAKFPDIDTPNFTVCRSKVAQNEKSKNADSATEVLLMGVAATAAKCKCPKAATVQPVNDVNCQELIKTQAIRLQELEKLLTQQQQLHQTINSKLNELQCSTKQEARPKAGAGPSTKTMGRITQTIGRPMTK